LAATRATQIPASVFDWLLERNEPSIRYLTFSKLLELDDSDDRVTQSRAEIGKGFGWAFDLLSAQREQTWWDNPSHCYVPKYKSCVWNLIVLADLGITAEDPRVRNASEHFLGLHNVDSGGFSLFPIGSEKIAPHICLTGNMIRTLSCFGYTNDSRIKKAVDWLLTQQLPDGGWNCYMKWGGKHSSFKSTIEPLSALTAVVASRRKNPEYESAMSRAKEFLLKHRLFLSDVDGSIIMLDFKRFHYTIHYHYDVLHALGVLTEPGSCEDSRLEPAVSLLLAKRQAEGYWVLDGTYRGWRSRRGQHGQGSVWRPEEEEIVEQGWGDAGTLQLEEAGKASKWVTLQALLVLKRLGFLEQITRFQNAA